MTSSTLTVFPVGSKNGGMILLKFNDVYKTTVLIDCAIGDGLIADYCDVNQELRQRLPLDSKGRPYVDAFILTHRHEDHLKGLQKHFYLGDLDKYNEGEEELKIIVKELWSTYLFWKPASECYSLCDDAKAFNKEMKRRVELYRDSELIQSEGNRAIIIGKDPDGKTDGLGEINYDIEDTFTKVNNRDLYGKLKGYILSPIEKQEGEDDEAFIDKNRQSIVLQLTVSQNDYDNKILVTGDAECLVWDTLWDRYQDSTSVLEYDILFAPHHCSWHSISYDSQSQDDSPEVCENAIKALGQSKNNAFIVSQSKIIKGSDEDPPSVEAKSEYVSLVGEKQFICTNEFPDEKQPVPLEFNLTGYGPQKKGIKEKSKLSQAALSSTREAYPHG